MFNKPRLLDEVREEIRKRHYSYRTEKQYVSWIRRFILFSGRRHPARLGGPDVERFLSTWRRGDTRSALGKWRHVICMSSR